MGEDADLHLTRQVRDLVAELLQAEVQADKGYLDHFYDDGKERTKEVEG